MKCKWEGKKSEKSTKSSQQYVSTSAWRSRKNLLAWDVSIKSTSKKWTAIKSTTNVTFTYVNFHFYDKFGQYNIIRKSLPLLKQIFFRLTTYTYQMMSCHKKMWNYLYSKIPDINFIKHKCAPPYKTNIFHGKTNEGELYCNTGETRWGYVRRRDIITILFNKIFDVVTGQVKLLLSQFATWPKHQTSQNTTQIDPIPGFSFSRTLAGRKLVPSRYGRTHTIWGLLWYWCWS